MAAKLGGAALVAAGLAVGAPNGVPPRRNLAVPSAEAVVDPTTLPSFFDASSPGALSVASAGPNRSIYRPGGPANAGSGIGGVGIAEPPPPVPEPVPASEAAAAQQREDQDIATGTGFGRKCDLGRCPGPRPPINEWISNFDITRAWQDPELRPRLDSGELYVEKSMKRWGRIKYARPVWWARNAAEWASWWAGEGEDAAAARLESYSQEAVRRLVPDDVAYGKRGSMHLVRDAPIAAARQAAGLPPSAWAPVAVGGVRRSRKHRQKQRNTRRLRR
jgi:hypothetical protein